MKAKFIMPEFLADSKVNIKMLDLIEKRPDSVQEHAEIYGFYGNFPNCIWNGGRFITGSVMDKNKIKETFKLYNDYYGLPLRLTFTNPVLDDEKYCHDIYANLIAECGHNGKNEILVSSPILEEYLRKNYPNYKYCKSIVSTETIPYDIQNYHMSVIPRTWINDLQKLNDIPMGDRKKIEIICNDACIDDCPHTYDHYREIGKATLDYTMSPKAQCIMTQTFDADFPAKDLNHTKRYVNPWLITHSYMAKGYEYFKLCGRENPAKRRMNWLKYIFKLEYQEDIFTKMWGL